MTTVTGRSTGVSLPRARRRAAAGLGVGVQAAPTATETANIQVVKDFCAAWPSHDLDRILSFFGLAVALIAVSLLYQRFVFRKEPRS
jgi:uncharacterized membrane protein